MSKRRVWLLVFGYGPTSESWAEKLALRCDERGIDYELRPVDEVHDKDLSLFGVLVVVLPSVADGAQPLDRFVEIIRAYRARHRVGLAGLLDGDRTRDEVGVVLVYDDAEVYPRREIQSIQRAICRYESVSGDADLNPFATYEVETTDVDPGPPADPVAPDVADVRKILVAWGVAWSYPRVAEVRHFIEQHRVVYENPRFHNLIRPIPGRDDNRFDFVLDDPDYRPAEEVCDGKKWTEGGQRTVTRALNDLSQRYPDVCRPLMRAGRRDLQKDFIEFYRALCVAEELLRSPE